MSAICSFSLFYGTPIYCLYGKVPELLSILEAPANIIRSTQLGNYHRCSFHVWEFYNQVDLVMFAQVNYSYNEEKERENNGMPAVTRKRGTSIAVEFINSCMSPVSLRVSVLGCLAQPLEAPQVGNG